MTILDGIIYGSLFLIVLITIFSTEARVKRIEKRIRRVENSLALILTKLEIEPTSQLSERVKYLARDPYRKIEAIKVYREESNCTLREAKEAIEDFLDGQNLS